MKCSECEYCEWDHDDEMTCWWQYCSHDDSYGSKIAFDKDCLEICPLNNLNQI